MMSDTSPLVPPSVGEPQLDEEQLVRHVLQVTRGTKRALGELGDILAILSDETGNPRYYEARQAVMVALDHVVDATLQLNASAREQGFGFAEDEFLDE